MRTSMKRTLIASDCCSSSSSFFDRFFLVWALFSIPFMSICSIWMSSSTHSAVLLRFGKNCVIDRLSTGRFSLCNCDSRIAFTYSEICGHEPFNTISTCNDLANS